MNKNNKKKRIEGKKGKTKPNKFTENSAVNLIEQFGTTFNFCFRTGARLFALQVWIEIIYKHSYDFLSCNL